MAYVYISWYTNDILLLITYNLTKEYKPGLDLRIGSCSQNTWNIVILWPSWSCEAVHKIARVSISTTISGKQLSVAESWSPTQTNCAMLYNIQPIIILISDSFTNHTKPTSLGEVGVLVPINSRFRKFSSNQKYECSTLMSSCTWVNPIQTLTPGQQSLSWEVLKLASTRYTCLLGCGKKISTELTEAA